MGYAHGWRANPAVEYQIIANHQIHPDPDSNPGIPNRPRRTLIWSIAPCGWPICPASMFRPGSPGVWPTRIWSACLGDRRCSTTLYSTTVFSHMLGEIPGNCMKLLDYMPFSILNRYLCLGFRWLFSAWLIFHFLAQYWFCHRGHGVGSL